MATDFHVRVREVLEDVVQLQPAVRELFLQSACGEDAALLYEVCSLLPHYEMMCGFEPTRPPGAWVMPGTTTFSRIRREAAREDSEDVEPQPPFTLDRYTVLEVLGYGGMGVVYRAIHPTLHRLVAIKVLRRRLVSALDRRRFAFEEEIMRQLQHPGIARFSHSGYAQLTPIDPYAERSDERPYFVMEYVPGLPLTQSADTQGLDVRARLALLVKVCGALEYAHQRGVVHCDLKPANILVDKSGQPKILDFGISRIAAFQAWPELQKEGRFAGTPSYASPEQFTGHVEQLTPRSDVFTLGLIAHELLSGQLPRRKGGRLVLRLETVHLNDPSDDRAGVNAEFRHYLRGILATALRQTRGQHYQSAGEFGADLQNLLEHYPAPASWTAALRHSLGGLLRPQNEWRPGPLSRPLSAMVRRRIAQALDTSLGEPTDE